MRRRFTENLIREPSAAAPTAPDIKEQLVKLNNLKEAGILSEEEFNAKKSELLSKMSGVIS